MALILGKVGIVVDSLVVSAAKELIVGKNVLKVLLEKLFAGSVLFSVVGLRKVPDILSEGVGGVKLMVLGGLGLGRGGKEE